MTPAPAGEEVGEGFEKGQVAVLRGVESGCVEACDSGVGLDQVVDGAVNILLKLTGELIKGLYSYDG